LGSCGVKILEVSAVTLDRKGITVLDHPPYSPDLAPADFRLFPKVKSAMKVDRHDSIQDIPKEYTQVLSAIPQKEYSDCLQNF
jgi:hypothetical protein